MKTPLSIWIRRFVWRHFKKALLKSSKLWNSCELPEALNHWAYENNIIRQSLKVLSDIQKKYEVSFRVFDGSVRGSLLIFRYCSSIISSIIRLALCSWFINNVNTIRVRIIIFLNDDLQHFRIFWCYFLFKTLILTEFRTRYGKIRWPRYSVYVGGCYQFTGFILKMPKK